MPRRTAAARKPRQRKPPPGPYDLSTIKLPGGSEMDALATGFATERSRMLGYRQGRVETEARANIATVTYTSTALGVFNPDKNGGLLIPMTVGQFRTEFDDELKAWDNDNGKRGDDKLHEPIKSKTGTAQGITNDTWMKRLDTQQGRARGESRFVGIPHNKFTEFPNGILVAGGQTFKNLLNANRPIPALRYHI